MDAHPALQHLHAHVGGRRHRARREGTHTQTEVSRMGRELLLVHSPSVVVHSPTVVPIVRGSHDIDKS